MSQELAVARAAEEAAQFNGLPLDIPNDVCTILFSGVVVSLILHNTWQFMQVDPIQEEPPPLPPPPPSPEPQLSAAGRRVRRRVLPRHYLQDNPPELPPAAVAEPLVPPAPNEPDPPPRQCYYTQPNPHGLYKIYPSRPSRDPDGEINLEDLFDSPFHLRLAVNTGLPQPAPLVSPQTQDTMSPWFLFLSATVACLMCWFYGGSNQKSVAELDSLVHGVILPDDFSKEDLTGFSCRRETDRLDHGFDVAGDTPVNGARTSPEDTLFDQAKGGGIGHRTQTKPNTPGSSNEDDELDNGVEEPDLFLNEDEVDALVNEDSGIEDEDLSDEMDDSEPDVDANRVEEDEEEVEDIIAEEGFTDY
ncbi:hypothetical protein EYR40_001551 [Pleurotus pulmonarius]|nr:hypothetical protein EYR36_000094 [Pleurotus pulmonarius]KAF4604372.1 hypothetical protein EYR38_004794 [Pleurotus pulmonarius]KAF4609198.1 hypothetical protein EYR40_001551 [Pleurotus pulmonarius]